MKYSILSGAALLASTVSAHGGVVSYAAGPTKYAGWSPYNSASGQTSIERQYSTFDPLLKADLSTALIRCNKPGGVTGTGISATVAAGSTFTAYWSQWTHAEGCVMVYMAKCPASGCNSFDGAGSVWFKIDQVGLISGTMGKGKWGPGLVMDTLSWDVTIPAALPSGEYLIRHELLALHQGLNPQFYPECAQLIVTGGGSGVPSPLTSFPGAYVATDPDVNVDITNASTMPRTSYTCPGPAVWGSSGGSSPPKSSTTAAPVPTSTATTLKTTTRSTTPEYYPPTTTSSSVKTTTTSSTTVKTTTTSAAPTTTASSGGCVAAQYAQCGGTGFTGCTSCGSFTCKVLNAYYSQCT